VKQNRTNQSAVIENEAAPQNDSGSNNVLDFSTTLKELRKHVDPELVKQREGWRDRYGNVQMVDYVEWHTVADILDETAPNWEHSVKDIRQIGDIMTVTVAITIDSVTREGIGTGLANSEMGIKKAEHDALKRAAVKFGIARDLYKKEFDAFERVAQHAEQPAAPQNQQQQPQAEEEPRFPSDPVAKSLADMVTGKQLNMIRALARELNMDADEECESQVHCQTGELSKRAASSFIQHLQNMQSQGHNSGRPPIRRAG
jgi:hypothetical protein